MSNSIPSNGNGSLSKVFPWVIGAILVPITMTVFGHLFNTTYTNAQRTSVLETEFKEIKTNLRHITEQLDRVLEGRK
jgi:hypothetical protein